jgi:hypothetical protein
LVVAISRNNPKILDANVQPPTLIVENRELN